MVLKQAPLPVDIVKLGVEGVNKIWREAKLRAVGYKRAKTLVKLAEHSVGSHISYRERKRLDYIGRSYNG